MLWLTAAISVFGAFANAFATILQKLSSNDSKSDQLFSSKFIKKMVTHKLWIAGVSLDCIGFLFQATALYIGTIVVVEPVLTVDTVIVFMVAHFGFKARTGRQGWLGVALVSLGISAFLIAANPHGGNNAASNGRSAIAIIFVTVVVAAVVVIMRKTSSDKSRVVAGAIATGLNFSLSAILTKMTVSDLSHGFAVMVLDWPLWAMIISAVSAVVIMQSTYTSGSLKLSQPIIAIVGPICSVAFGIFLFQTHVRSNWPYLFIEIISAFAIMIGIVFLTGSKAVSSFEGDERL